MLAQAPKKYPKVRGESPQEPESSGHVARQYLDMGDGSWTAGGDKPICDERVPCPMGRQVMVLSRDRC